MVRTRVLYGALMIIGLGALLIADAALSDPSRIRGPVGLNLLGFGGLSTLAIGLIVIAGAVELSRLCRSAGYDPAAGWAVLSVALLVLGPWLRTNAGWISVSTGFAGFARLGYLDPLLPWIALFGTGTIMVWRQKTTWAIGHVATTLLIIFYVGYLGSFGVRLRCWQPGADGALILAGVLLVVKSSDIGAYFTGLAIGRTKLIPKISPNKTWEGFIGGLVVGAAVSGLVLRWGVPAIIRDSVLADLTLQQALVFGLVMAVAGQLGDLLESLFKRDTGAKDSGSVVPEFGGVLDLIDSPLFAVPVGYWLLMRWLVP
jgi:phosphatidate cytidylyltransferase